jgi:hypothetical protein
MDERNVRKGKGKKGRNIFFRADGDDAAPPGLSTVATAPRELTPAKARPRRDAMGRTLSLLPQVKLEVA